MNHLIWPQVPSPNDSAEATVVAIRFHEVSPLVQADGHLPAVFRMAWLGAAGATVGMVVFNDG